MSSMSHELKILAHINQLQRILINGNSRYKVVYSVVNIVGMLEMVPVLFLF